MGDDPDVGAPSARQVEAAFEFPIGAPVGAWVELAACRDQDVAVWFPGRGESLVEAKAVCRRCPVQVECLLHALDNGEKHGVWGGRSERERRRLRRRRQLNEREEESSDG